MPGTTDERTAAHRVVVGYHGTAASRQALLQALGVARERGWDLELVTAWPDADEVFIHDVPGHYIVARGQAMQWQHEALDSLDPALLSHVSAYLFNDRPVAALVARCAGADLLVLGKGHVATVDPEIGLPETDVGAACAAAAPCPLVIVPVSDARTPARAARRGKDALLP